MSAAANLKRAAWAEMALLAFRRASHSDHEDCLVDLLSDLMIWSRFNHFDFDLALDRARMHYEAEA